MTTANWAVLVPAIVGCLSAIAAYVRGRTNTSKIEEVHLMVNGRLDGLLKRVDQLTQSLRDADVAVPRKPNGERT
jgi:hypothetical protein